MGDDDVMSDDDVMAEVQQLMNDKHKKQSNAVLMRRIHGVLRRVQRAPGGAALGARLYHSGLLDWALELLEDTHTLIDEWSGAVKLAHTLCISCCQGAGPGQLPEAFYRILLPSLVDTLLSLANQLRRRGEGTKVRRLFKEVLNALTSLLQQHLQLSKQVLSCHHYEEMSLADDVTVSLECLLMWTRLCQKDRDFVRQLEDDSVMLLLNEAVGPLAVSSDTAVGGAAIRLVLLITSQLDARHKPLLLDFKGLDQLLQKDWRGRGFNQEVDRLVFLLQDAHTHTQPARHTQEQAACVIQAAWRSYEIRRRIKTLHRTVCVLQRTYRSHLKRRKQKEEAKRREEELKYQVSVSRLRSRREFHQKQILQMLPSAQVSSYLLHQCVSAAVCIQRVWRGFLGRRRARALRHTHTQEQAARVLQRAVIRFLRRRRAQKAPSPPFLWTGPAGLTDSRRVELRRQVEEYIRQHPAPGRTDHQELHEKAQRLLGHFLLGREEDSRRGERRRALEAEISSHLELLTNAPSLSVVRETDVALFSSRSGPVAARARQAHNALLRAANLPWWRRLGEDDVTSCPDTQDLLDAGLGGLYLGGVEPAHSPDASNLD